MSIWKPSEWPYWARAFFALILLWLAPIVLLAWLSPRAPAVHSGESHIERPYDADASGHQQSAALGVKEPSKADDEKGEAGPEAPNWADQLIALGTLALVFGTLALALYTRSLFLETRRAAKEALDHANEATERQKAQYATLLEFRLNEVKAAHDQARAAERAVEVATENFAAERRPWIKISIEPTGLVRAVEDRAWVEMRFVRANVGLSPAYNIRTILEKSERSWWPEWDDRLKQTVAAAADGNDAIKDGSTIFPGDPDHVVWDVEVPCETNGYISAWLFGYVVYASAISGKVHVTPFIRTLMADIDPENTTKLKAWRVGLSPFSIPPT